MTNKVELIGFYGNDEVHATGGAIFADAPNETHIQKLLKFIRSLSSNERLLVHCFIRSLSSNERLLVHCFAGYSRSPAAVIIAKCERDDKTIHDAKQEIYDARIPDKLVPCPNDIMLHNYLMIK